MLQTSNCLHTKLFSKPKKKQGGIINKGQNNGFKKLKEKKTCFAQKNVTKISQTNAIKISKSCDLHFLKVNTIPH